MVGVKETHRDWCNVAVTKTPLCISFIIYHKAYRLGWATVAERKAAAAPAWPSIWPCYFNVQPLFKTVKLLTNDLRRIASRCQSADSQFRLRKQSSIQPLDKDVIRHLWGRDFWPQQKEKWKASLCWTFSSNPKLHTQIFFFFKLATYGHTLCFFCLLLWMDSLKICNWWNGPAWILYLTLS